MLNIKKNELLRPTVVAVLFCFVGEKGSFRTFICVIFADCLSEEVFFFLYYAAHLTLPKVKNLAQMKILGLSIASAVSRRVLGLPVPWSGTGTSGSRVWLCERQNKRA